MKLITDEEIFYKIKLSNKKFHLIPVKVLFFDAILFPHCFQLCKIKSAEKPFPAGKGLFVFLLVLKKDHLCLTLKNKYRQNLREEKTQKEK